MSACRDTFGREVNYLRVSITDRCNLRCVYCMPERGVAALPHAEILRYEEVERVVAAAVGLGIDRVRVTGGEPLVRRGAVGFVGRLARIEGLRDLALTTNGVLLAETAGDLAAAGLRRVNVSLDTLDAARFARVCRAAEGGLDRVLAGLDAALAAGLHPVKVNVVAMRGVNDDEAAAFAALTLDRPLHVRFIELMPLGESGRAEAGRFVPAAEIRSRLEAVGRPLLPVEGGAGEAGRAAGGAGLAVGLAVGLGPARYYRWGADAAGTVGFITPLTGHFCGACNRLRLTADGKLHPCLASEDAVDVKSVLRAGAGGGAGADTAAGAGAGWDDRDARLREAILAAVRRKPAGHRMRAPAEAAAGAGAAAVTDDSSNRRMSRIGG